VCVANLPVFVSFAVEAIESAPSDWSSFKA